MLNTVGSVARGDNFFDREEFVERLWGRLEAGNVLLLAPRRFGKTSVMYRLLDRPRSGWRVVHVDAESIREPVNFVVALLDALSGDQALRAFLKKAWSGAGAWARKTLDGWEVTTPWDVGVKINLKKAMGGEWPARAEGLLSVLSDYGDGERLLIIVDELPVMLRLFEDNDVPDSEVRAFLYWLRKLRTDPAVGLTECRFLVGGSIGADRYLSRLRASDSFNDFERVPLPHLTAARAGELLDALLQARELQVSPQTRQAALDAVGVPVPYFIQIVVSELAAVRDEGSASEITPRTVEEVYEQRVLGATCKSYFQHYYDRLRFYGKPEEAAAKAVLRELALAQAAGVQRDNLRLVCLDTLGEAASDESFAQLVADLENDFYVVYRPKDRSYVFASKILCDWWRRHYAF
jgi:hypothetical protein